MENHTKVFLAMKAEMEKGTYTLVEASETIALFLTHKQITRTEYDELYELCDTLRVNSSEDEDENWKVGINMSIQSLEKRVTSLETLLAHTPETDPDEPDGSKDNPYEAYRGLIYYKDKYYYDSEDSSLYICTRDSVIQLHYMPHELIGHYFAKVEDTGE